MESLGSFLGDSWEIIWTFLKIIWRFVGDSFGDFSEILLWRREEVEGGAGEGGGVLLLFIYFSVSF